MDQEPSRLWFRNLPADRSFVEFDHSKGQSILNSPHSELVILKNQHTVISRFIYASLFYVAGNIFISIAVTGWP